MKTHIIALMLCCTAALCGQTVHNEPRLQECEKYVSRLLNAKSQQATAEAYLSISDYLLENGLFDEGAMSAIQAFNIYSEMCKSPKKHNITLTELYKKITQALERTSANAIHSVGLGPTAEALIDQAIKMTKIYGNHAQYATLIGMKADFNFRYKRYSVAEKEYLKAIKEYNKANLTGDEIIHLKNRLATLYITTKEYQKAEKLLNEMPQSDLNMQSKAGFENIMCNRTCIAVIGKDYDKVAQLYKTATNRYRTAIDPKNIYGKNALNDYLLHLSLLATCCERQGEAQYAKEVYSDMRQLISEKHQYHIPFYTVPERLYLQDALESWHKQMQWFAYRHISEPGYTTFMFDNSQMMKRFFVSSHYGYTPKVEPVQNDPYLRETRKRIYEWQITPEVKNADVSGDYQPVIVANARMGALTKDAMDFMREAVNEPYNCNIGWKNMLPYVPEQEAIIEFIVVHNPDNGQRYYTALVCMKGEVPQFVNLCDEDTLLKTFHNTELDYKYLSEHIWKPIKNIIGDRPYITLSPTRMLCNIPFAALHDETDYLCGRYAFNYELSVTDRLNNNRTFAIYPENKSAVLFGGADYGLPPSRLNKGTRGGQGFHYLPSSRQEALEIANILKDKGCEVESYIGKNATEDAFKKLSDKSKSPFIIHISTHGFLLPYDETETSSSLNSSGKSRYIDVLMRTGLAFTGSNAAWKENSDLNIQKDGIVTAYEVSAMSFPDTELVVLSACNTGLGEVRGTEGVYGLQRSFRMSGAKSLIVSLAEVPDKEPAEYRSAFYQNWK